MSVANRFNLIKNYMNLLFHGGRVLQDSEMNEVMSLFFHQLAKTNQHILPEGSIFNSNILILEDQISCGSNFILLDGKFVYIPEKGLDKPDQSIYQLGVKYRVKTVTASDTEELNDQTVGSVNEGLPGADREVYEIVWATNLEVLEDDWKFLKVRTIMSDRLTKAPILNLRTLAEMAWDAVVSYDVVNFDNRDRCFYTLQEAIDAAPEGSRILVKDSELQIRKPILIHKDNLFIQFSPGVKFLADESFPGIGDNSEKSIFYVTGNNVTLQGGIHGFPHGTGSDPNVRPIVVSSSNSSTFFNEVRLVGYSNYSLIDEENVNVNGQMYLGDM